MNYSQQVFKILSSKLKANRRNLIINGILSYMVLMILMIMNPTLLKYGFELSIMDENAFNYELQKPISDELYELFKPFGSINQELGNKRLGEVFVINKAGKIVLVLQGRKGNTRLKVIIKDFHIAGAKTLAIAESKIQCQLTKYQMCLGCKACESVCKHDAISVKDDTKVSAVSIIEPEPEETAEEETETDADSISASAEEEAVKTFSSEETAFLGIKFPCNLNSIKKS